MIVIFTTNFDKSSIEVGRWLQNMNEDFVLFTELRIGKSPKLCISVEGNNLTSRITVNQREIDSAWIRKEPKREYEYYYQKSVAEFVSVESREYIKSIYSHIIHNEDIYVLGKYTFGYVAMNKLQMLELAKRCGLNIPAYLISNSKKDIQQFLNRYPKSICKAIREGKVFLSEDKTFKMDMYGKLLTRDLVDKIKTSFPNYVQEYIEKQIELRIFVIKNKVYSSAIFTQELEESQIDFRPVTAQLRIVPFQLPEEIETKILDFCAKANHNTGSIDMILDKDGKFVFLELNPSGQYNMVSTPCNYNLNKLIAKTLSNGSRKNKSNHVRDYR